MFLDSAEKFVTEEGIGCPYSVYNNYNLTIKHTHINQGTILLLFLDSS